MESVQTAGGHLCIDDDRHGSLKHFESTRLKQVFTQHRLADEVEALRQHMHQERRMNSCVSSVITLYRWGPSMQ
jgi:hypothetical protein